MSIFKKTLTTWIAVFVLAGVVHAQASVSKHLTMGNPSNADDDPRHSDNFLMKKPQYVLAYNKSNATANWVSWHLSNKWLGDEDRSDDFRADQELPAGWFRVTQRSYVKSGFDRGHICPSGDRTADPDDNSATFLMTNMMPQAPRNNQQTWKHLEDYSRSLVKSKKELFIIAGPAGAGGIGKKGQRNQLIDNPTREAITVPHSTWKVIMVLPEKRGDPIARVTTHTRLIAVVIPNEQQIETDWTEYRVSVDEVEELTGFNFFSELPNDIEDEIESITDDVEVD